jgi:hypothetical protein
MIRFYILPIEVIDTPTGLVRLPKYIHQFDVSWGMMDYGGLIDAAILAAEVTQGQHEQLLSNPDVEAAPENIDQNISDIAIPQVKAVMEQLRIPAGWVDNTYTYRQIFRMIAGLFQFAQHYYGIHKEPLIDNQGQLNLRWNQIPQDRQDRIIATADDLGYEYAEIQPTWLIRQVLKYLGDQWGDQTYHLGVVDL